MKVLSKTNPCCPDCSNISKKIGFQKNKLRKVQRYLCKTCHHSFTLQPNLQKSKTYNLKTILDNISQYNLGQPLRKQQIPSSTIHNWIKNFPFSFNRLRNKIKHIPTYQIIIKHQFIHHQQPFLYQYHNLKLEFTKKFPGLINYLKEINKSLPKQIFNNSERISQIAKITKETPTMAGEPGDAPSGVAHRFSEGKPRPIVVEVSFKSKQNYAVKLANIALSITQDNKKRHDIIENFMLINDTATIATEIPIYLIPTETNLRINKPLTGHIDIIQIRFNEIHILDFKPEAKESNETITQLYLYAKALSKRTNIPLKNFRCAYFDNKNYFEFYPSTPEKTKNFKNTAIFPHIR